MATHYPIVAKLHIHITDGNGTSGSATYQCPFNRLPTEAEMPDVLAKVRGNLPDGFRIMTRHESMMHFLREEKGYRGPNFALNPLDAGDEWHDPATANVHMVDGQDDDEELNEY